MRTLTLLLIAATATAAAACAPRNGTQEEGGSPETAAAAADTLRGTVAVVGAEPMTQVVLRSPDGGPDRLLAGDHLEELRRVSGMEVRVEGEWGEDRRVFEVGGFSVRALDGVPAVDGVLERDGDDFVLRLADGSARRLAYTPTRLRSEVGSRVWVAGPPDREPAAFGIIAPAEPD